MGSSVGRFVSAGNFLLFPFRFSAGIAFLRVENRRYHNFYSGVSMERFYRFGTTYIAALMLPVLAGFAVGAEPDAIQPSAKGVLGDVVTAMTFNIRVDTFIDGPNRWDKRKGYVYDLIADHAPDIVGLQEAKNGQYFEIRQALPMYQGYGVGRSNGAERGEMCPILYRGDRYLKTDSGTFWFSNTPDKPGSKDWGNWPPRICSWVRLTDRQTLSSFYVYNVHLDHMSQNSRSKSVRLLTQKIAARKTNDPYIVMGDFNMKMTNSAMQYLQKNTLAPMADAWTSLHGSRTTIGTRPGFNGSSGPKIDHILSKELPVVGVTIDSRKYNGRRPSDHLPVIARVLMPSRAFAEAPESSYEQSTHTLF
jgi:endonuclease/exonuclease/phosphatase family metal-dependent hydrolase